MKRVVVIDDEYIVVEGMRAILGRLALEAKIVGSATNGVDGLAVIREEKPDIVITDIRMPGLDGLSMIEEVKEEMPDTYFIIISGYTDFAYARWAIHLGVVSYIDKPVTIEKVEEAFSGIQKLEEKKKGRIPEKAGDEAVINALVLEDSTAFYEKAEEYVHRLEQVTSTFGALKEECYRFLCVIREVFAGQRRCYDEQMLLPCTQVMGLETKEKLFSCIRQNVEHMVNIMDTEKVGCDHRVINQILTYINGNYGRDIGLTELGELVDMNPAYLCILFKEEVGTSYVKYLTELRIKKAKKFLLEGKRVAEVSSMVGYSNYRYFCDIFKKHVGQTPNEFRCGSEK